jgi:IS1 family transposase
MRNVARRRSSGCWTGLEQWNVTVYFADRWEAYAELIPPDGFHFPD